MTLLQNFFLAFLSYCQELWWILVIGFSISGLLYKFVPAGLVERHLGGPGLKPILYASFAGTALPVCCFGSLPIAITLRGKGASLGAVMAFLIATPATSVPALIACWKLMGLAFAIYIFFAILIMAVVMGVLFNRMNIPIDRAREIGGDTCCADDHGSSGTSGASATPSQKIKEAIYYAFVTLPKEIGVEILVGIGVASFITVFEPVQHFIRDNLVGYVGYGVILVFGLLTYVCSTASVPMADAFLKSGMSYGQALTYLIAGPVTSYGAILAIKKEFGGRVLGVYLLLICFFSVAYGLIYDYLV